MQVGYNTNVSYKGKIYHVQTEDTGIDSFLIISLLYFKGAILASKKSSYAELKDHPELVEKVRDIMKEQHKGLIKELISGKYSAEDPAVSGSIAVQQGETGEEKKNKSLDEILIDYIIKQAGK